MPPFEMKTQELIQALKSAPPADLLVFRLLAAHSPAPGELFPAVSDGLLVEATTNLLDYNRRCHTLTTRLKHLAPIPLRGVSFTEYGL